MEGVLVEIGIPILYEVAFSQTVPLLGQPDHFFVQPVSVEGTDCVAGLVWKDRGVLLMTDTLIGEECDTLKGSRQSHRTVNGLLGQSTAQKAQVHPAWWRGHALARILTTIDTVRDGHAHFRQDAAIQSAQASHLANWPSFGVLR